MSPSKRSMARHPQHIEHDVFLSHSSKDKGFARALAGLLRRAGLRVWVDEDDISWGESIQRAITQGIRKSRHLVLLMSPDSVGFEGGPEPSDWTEAERLLAQWADPANRERAVLCLKIRPCDAPWDVRPYKYLDVTTEAKLSEALGPMLAVLGGALPKSEPLWTSSGAAAESKGGWTPLGPVEERAQGAPVQVLMVGDESGLEAHWEEAARVVEEEGGCQPLPWQTGQQADPGAIPLKELRRADVVIFLVAWRYGLIPKDQHHSAIHEGLILAHHGGREILGLLLDEDAPWPRSAQDRDLGPVEGLREELSRAAGEAGSATFGAEPESVAEPLARLLLLAKERVREKRQASPPHPRPKRPSPPSLALRIARALEKQNPPRPIPGASRSLDLSTSYVRLRLAPELRGNALACHFEERRKLEAGDQDLRKRLSDREGVDVDEALDAHKRLVVLGDPGAGKTTLLLHLLHRSRAALERGKADARLPLFLRLRELAKTPARSHGPLLDELIAEAVKLTGASEDKVKALVIDHLARGRLLVLLDGLDELEVEAQAEVQKRVDGLLRTLQEAGGHPDNQAIVTCRVLGYQHRCQAAEATYQVEPFSDADIAAFLSHWFRGEPARQALGAELNQRLAISHARVRELGRTPLLLGLLSFYYEKNRDLPRRRARLYEELVVSLLSAWKGDERGQVYGDEKEPVLLDLAAMAFSHPETPLSFKECKAVIRKHGVRTKLEKPIAPDRVLRELVKDNGLLVELEQSRQYAFLHLTLEEYLVAKGLVEGGGWREAAEHFAQDRRWAEVFILAGALMTDGGPLLVALSQAGASLEVIEAVSRDAERIGLVALRDLAALGLKQTPPSSPCTLLGACFKGLMEQPECSMAQGLVELESGIGQAPLLGLYRDILEEDTRLHGQEGHRVDPVLAWVAISHLRRWVGREQGAREAAQVLEAWRGPPLSASSWVEVPAGSFAMGSDEGDEDERPVHRVSVRRFSLGRFPVTNSEYEAFHPVQVEWLCDNQARFSDVEQPVVYVTWYAAWSYAAWRGARLPSEAEWEYAARGEESHRYPWGDEPEPTVDLAHFDQPWGEGATRAVGSCPDGRAWCGAEELAGNVFEWCEDGWHSNYEGAPEDGRAWEDGDDSSRRVVRGGSWYLNAGGLRAAYRDRYRADLRSYFVGFRVALSSPPSVDL